MAYASFTDMFSEKAERLGRKAVAETIGLDQGDYSKFLSGLRGLVLPKLDKMLEEYGLVIASPNDINDMERAMFTVLDRYKAHRMGKPCSCATN